MNDQLNDLNQVVASSGFSENKSLGRSFLLKDFHKKAEKCAGCVANICFLKEIISPNVRYYDKRA